MSLQLCVCLSIVHVYFYFYFIYLFILILVFYFEENGISTRVLFKKNLVPVCMQCCKFCHAFPPAHNGLLVQKCVCVCRGRGGGACVRIGACVSECVCVWFCAYMRPSVRVCPCVHEYACIHKHGHNTSRPCVVLSQSALMDFSVECFRQECSVLLPVSCGGLCTMFVCALFLLWVE